MPVWLPRVALSIRFSGASIRAQSSLERRKILLAIDSLGEAQRERSAGAPRMATMMALQSSALHFHRVRTRSLGKTCNGGSRRNLIRSRPISTCGWCGWDCGLTKMLRGGAGESRTSRREAACRPQQCGPFTAVQVVLGLSDPPTFSPPSLSVSRSHLANDEAHALYHGYATPAWRERVRH